MCGGQPKCSPPQPPPQPPPWVSMIRRPDSLSQEVVVRWNRDPNAQSEAPYAVAVREFNSGEPFIPRSPVSIHIVNTC